MAAYNINPVDGVQTVKTNSSGLFSHDVAFRPTGTPTGTIILKGRKAGSDVFEEIPGGTFDLSSLDTAQFVGSVSEYELTITGISGIHVLTLTDTESQG